jgi:nicotinate phosphoribosyltransferase
MTENSLISLSLEGTDENSIRAYTDDYFLNTAKLVAENGESIVTYAAFIRRPSVMAVKIAIDWLKRVAREQDFPLHIIPNFEEGDSVGAGDPLLYITGPLSQLAPLETLFLQKLGPTCVAAMNARDAGLAYPSVPFIAMDARHDSGREMQEMMGYAAFIGSEAAKKQKPGTRGFIGTANEITSRLYFGQETGMGTMPHAYVGYVKNLLHKSGDTETNPLVHAAQLYREQFPQKKFIVLPDYDGREVTDSLAVCRAFPQEAQSGELMFRLDTHGGRYIEGLDKQGSYDVMERRAPSYMRGMRTPEELSIIYGEGVTVSAVWHFREKLDEAGFTKVKIVGSSGFNTLKCRVMAQAGAPLDYIGTGSFLPENWKETYATADIICYDGNFSVKIGREHLISAYQAKFGTSQPPLPKK